MSEKNQEYIASFGEWRVCLDGSLDAPRQSYWIEVGRMFEDDWVSHMREKNWVNISSFIQALEYGRKKIEENNSLVNEIRNCDRLPKDLWSCVQEAKKHIKNGTDFGLAYFKAGQEYGFSASVVASAHGKLKSIYKKMYAKK